MDDLVIYKIKQQFIENHHDELVLYPNEAGKTLQNLIASEKTKSAVDAIEFTIHFLNNPGKYLEN